MRQAELYGKARSGDELALKDLYEIYHPVVYYLQRRYKLNLFEEDDWFQWGFIIFDKCVDCYDEDFGISLGRYFKICYKNFIVTRLKRQWTYRNRSNITTISLERNVVRLEDKGVRSLISDDDPLQQLLLKEAIETSSDYLSKFEQEAFSDCLINEEVAGYKAQSNRRAHQQACYRAKRKLTRYSLNE